MLLIIILKEKIYIKQSVMKKLLYLILLLPFVAIGQADTIYVNPGDKIIIVAPDAIDQPPVIDAGPKFMLNVGNEIDHHPNIKGIGCRYFWIASHDFYNKGNLSKGGKLPRDMVFSIPDVQYPCRGVDYNGTMCDNSQRVERLANQYDEVTIVVEAVQDHLGNWLGFPFKFVPLWQWGVTPGERYAKIKEHFKAVLKSTKGKVQYIEIANEPWGLTAEEYNIKESARFAAWFEYNFEEFGLGLDQYEQFTPKLGTAALPIGQGLRSGMSLSSFANPKYSKYYSYVSVHPYNLVNGDWVDDPSISDAIINTAIEFCKQYMPHCKIRITETGAPQDMIRNQINYLVDKSNDEHIERVFLYGTFSDDSSIFKDCFFYDENGPTQIAKEFKLFKN